MIQVNNLSKNFDGHQALDALTMNIPTGSIYGLIGTNGAGKTTIIKHLAGILREDSGEIFFDGDPVWENEAVKARIGLIPDDLWFPAGYTLNKLKNYYSGIYAETWDPQTFDSLVHAFRLDPNARIRGFSKGMKKQAAFCCVMAARPDYLLLDEPIDGLDPIVRKLVWKTIVEDVADRQMTVLVSSHNLKEMEGICDSIGILSKGHMVIEQDLDSLRSGIHKVQVSLRKDSRPEGDPYEGLNVLRRESRGAVDLLLVGDHEDTLHRIIDPLDPVIFDILPVTLEEMFIYELGGEDDEINELLF